MSPVLLRLFSGGLLAVTLLLLSTSSTRSNELEPFLQNIRNAPPKSQKSLLYALSDSLTRGSISIGSDEDALLFGELLRDLLLDENLEVRRVAARFIPRYPHPIVADAAFETLQRDPSATEAHSLRSFLVSLGDTRVFPFLLASFKNAEAGRKYSTAGVLGDFGDKRALPVLKQFLSDSLRFKATLLGTELDRNPGNLERAQGRANHYWLTARSEVESAMTRIDLKEKSKIKCLFSLPQDSIQRLEKNGFVVTPTNSREMFDLYDATYPLVTTDLAFHTFMIFVQGLVSELEQLFLEPELKSLSLELFLAAKDQVARADDPNLKKASLRNAARFAIPVLLMGLRTPEELDLPNEALALVQTELQLTENAAGRAFSPVWERQVAYSEFAPRYRLQQFKSRHGYARAMEYFGRHYWQAHGQSDLTQLLLVAELFVANPQLLDRLNRIDDVLIQFFGQNDDLTIHEVIAAWSEVSDTQTPLSTVGMRSLLDDPEKIALFVGRLERQAPRINSSAGLFEDWRRNTLGLRVMGKKYQITNHLFQELLDLDVQPLSGLFIAAELLGSGQAASLLPDGSASSFSALPPFPNPEDPYASLMDGLVHCGKALFDLDSRVNESLTTPAWEDKQLNTAMGSWVEVENTTALYTKNAMVTLGGGSMMNDKFHGYVEPYPLFYARLDSLLTRIIQVAQEIDLFNRIEDEKDRVRVELVTKKNLLEKGSREDRYRVISLQNQLLRTDRASARELSTILKRFLAISERELSGQRQTVDDGVFLKNLGRRLKFLYAGSSHAAPKPMGLIASPASNTGEHLQVAVGLPHAIYAAIPFEGEYFVCKGAIYSYFESWGTDRLDQETWLNSLKDKSKLLGLSLLEQRGYLGTPIRRH